jgi:hypothetical protein
MRSSEATHNENGSAKTNMRVALWRLWVVAALIWTVGTVWWLWPDLSGDCSYFEKVGDQAGWLACRHGPDHSFLALAWIVVPPPLVIIVGYWVLRALGPSYAAINKRIAFGVAFMPLWVAILLFDLMDIMPSVPSTPTNRDRIVGDVIIHILFALPLLSLVFGKWGAPKKESSE